MNIINANDNKNSKVLKLKGEIHYSNTKEIKEFTNKKINY
jgi:hypothetical protein